MAVPLFSGEETFGMVYVDNPFDNRFTEEDLQVLTTIASVASIKIEHERLLEERLEKRRMDGG
jgi:GAF domain-containing protein